MEDAMKFPPVSKVNSHLETDDLGKIADRNNNHYRFPRGQGQGVSLRGSRKPFSLPIEEYRR